jgi:hypothetical protein
VNPAARWTSKIKAEADEGMLLLEFATRMRLRNRIVVDILTSDGTVDPDAWARATRNAIRERRAEVEASARRVGREARASWFTSGRARHQHDYRFSDLLNLARRRFVYRLLARRLLVWEHDPAQSAALLDRARRDAQDEIAAEIGRVVSDSATGVEDESVLRERLVLIATVDLPALEFAMRRAAPESGPDPDPIHRHFN